MTNFNLASSPKTGNSLNSLGRDTGRKFNMAAFKREFQAKMKASEKAAETFEAQWEKARQKRINAPLVTIKF